MSQRYIGGLIYNPPGGFSGAFDGSGDYLTAPDGAAFTVGSGDWTLEAWIFSTATGSQKIAGQLNAAGQTTSLSFGIALTSSNQPIVEAGSGATYYSASSSTAVPLNAWTHIAAVRDGTTIRLYVNGTQAATVSVSTNSLNDSSDPFGIGRYGSYDALYFSGYISNLRFVKGTCLYPSGTAFNPPSGQLQAVTNTQLLTCAYGTFRDGSTNNFTITVNGNTAVSTQNPFPLTTLPNPALGNQGNGVYSMSQYQSLLSQNLWPAVDPYWRYVTLMLHGNGTNGAQNNTFLDSSTNNFTITRNGNTTQGTFAPFGSNWSNYFDGSGDYLSVADNAALDLSTGDFTIECWVFPVTGISDVDGLISKRNQSTFTGSDWRIAYRSASTAFGIATGSNNTDRLTPAITLNAWNHVAFVRSSGTLSCYANGTRGDTLTWTENLDNSQALLIGLNVPGFDLPGYISNVRIVKGTAVYSGSTYTVPTSPLTAITNTSLLTCQSNRFVDNSTNNFTVSIGGGTPSVQRFSPFNPTAPYAAGTDGGSGYFDGSGDYLDISSNSVLTPSGDFTIEFWAYPKSASGIREWYSKGNGIQVYSNGTAWSLALSSNNSGTYFINASFGTLVANQWQHVVVTRSGNSYVGFVNGVATSLGTSSSAPSTGTDVLRIGDFSGSAIYPVVGYMSAVRFVNGTAVYGTSTFIPPTTPPTSITNTQFLANFTNAGILDNAEMNNLETVGNAQISTAQSKFGGASMAFDGNGDVLTAPPSQYTNYINGSGDWTYEFWVYYNSLPSGGTYGASIYAQDDGAGVVSPFNIVQQGNTWKLWGSTNGSAWDIFDNVTLATTSLSTSIWYHIAFVRNAGTLKMYVNGTQVASTTLTASININTTRKLWLFGTWQNNPSNAGGINGYIDDLRLTKGYARYTTSFTPQRSQWQDQ